MRSCLLQQLEKPNNASPDSREDVRFKVMCTFPASSAPTTMGLVCTPNREHSASIAANLPVSNDVSLASDHVGSVHG